MCRWDFVRQVAVLWNICRQDFGRWLEGTLEDGFAGLWKICREDCGIWVEGALEIG